MSGTATAPAPVSAEPTKIPPPVAAGSQGAGALADDPTKKAAATENPFEFELDIKGQKQKLVFQNKEQMKAVLQKALYADQVIKDGTQAKKGADILMQKLKTEDGLREVLNDPDINFDIKKFALKIVSEMMEDEKLTPEQREFREVKAWKAKREAEDAQAAETKKQTDANKKLQENATRLRSEIIAEMEKYPDIPKTQATIDGIILNMRAGFKRFGKHLTAQQAMTVYSQQYWNALGKTLESMTPEKILERFGQKALDKIQKFRLNQLKEKTDPSKQKQTADGSAKKKKNLTEKEFDKHFQELAGGL